MLLAQVSSDFAPFLQAGIPGIVLAWFMIRNEKRLCEVSESVDRMSKAILLLVVNNSKNPEVISQANSLLDAVPKPKVNS